MLNNLLRHDDYVAAFGYDESANALHGRVIGIPDVVDFYGRDIDELKTEFKAAVEDYRDWCRSEGEEPSPSRPSSLTLAPSESQHRRILAAAAARGQTVEAWVMDVLDRESRQGVSQVPRAG